MALALAVGIDGQHHQPVQGEIEAHPLELVRRFRRAVVPAGEDDPRGGRRRAGRSRGGGLQSVEQARDGDVREQLVGQPGDPHAPVQQRAVGLVGPVPYRRRRPLSRAGQAAGGRPEALPDAPHVRGSRRRRLHRAHGQRAAATAASTGRPPRPATAGRRPGRCSRPAETRSRATPTRARGFASGARAGAPLTAAAPAGTVARAVSIAQPAGPPPRPPPRATGYRSPLLGRGQRVRLRPGVRRDRARPLPRLRALPAPGPGLAAARPGRAAPLRAPRALRAGDLPRPGGGRPRERPPGGRARRGGRPLPGAAAPRSASPAPPPWTGSPSPARPRTSRPRRRRSSSCCACA